MSVFVNIISDFDDKGLRNATGQLRNFASNAGKIAAGVTASLAAIGTGIAIRGITQFTRSAISEATDLGEAVNAVNVAFGDAASGIEAIGRTSAEQMGLAKTEFFGAAVQFSAFAEDIARGAGRDVPSVIQDITQRGADFASVYNIDVADALAAFQSGLSGEIEPLKRFGIVLSAETVKNFAYANSIAAQGEELTEQQKVLARYGLLMEETSKVQGDFVNTSDSLANRQRILAASFADIQAEVGVALLPAMEEFAQITQDDLLPLIAELATEAGPILAEVLSQVADLFRDALDPSTELGGAVSEMGGAFQDLFTTLVGGQGSLTDAKDELASIFRFVRDITNFLESMTAGFIGAKYAIDAMLEGDWEVVGQFLEMDTVQFVNEIVRAEGALSNLEQQARNTNNAVSATMFIGPGLDPSTGRSFFEAPGAAEMPKRPKPGQVFTWFKYGRDGQADWYQQRWTGSEWTDPELMTYDPPSTGGGGGGGTAAKTAGDFVNDFFSGLDDAVAKETARMELEDLGISDALIDNILGAQGWSYVYDEIVTGGQSMADSLQEQFNQTAEGAKELAEELERIRDLETAMGDALEMANAAGGGLTELFEASENLGETAQGVQDYFDSLLGGLDNLLSAEEFASVQSDMEDWFNRNLFTIETYANRRDALLKDRAFATDLIFGTAEAITAAGDLTTLIDNTLNKTKEIDVSEVIEGVVDSADGLRGFKTTITRNYTEVIEETASAADNLTSNFRGVVERTKDFLANLKTLKELGLDPMLFNSLVEAGVEAGGATAQALVDGGAETVNEVNSLQDELEELGVDIGEETYETMKNAGEQFTSGIVDGINANLDSIEVSAESAAEMFAQAFEEELQRLLGNLQLPTIGGGGGGGAGVIPRPGDFAPGAETTFDGKDIFKIRNPTSGQSLADIASEYGVDYDAIVDANPKFFDPGHKDYKSGYQGGEYLYDNTLVNVPKLADGGIAMGQVLAMIGEAGPEAVIPLNKLDGMMNGNGTTYNIYVNSSGRSGGQQAGQEIVKALKQYQTTNGSINNALTGFGA